MSITYVVCDVTLDSINGRYVSVVFNGTDKSQKNSLWRLTTIETDKQHRQVSTPTHTLCILVTNSQSFDNEQEGVKAVQTIC